MASRWLTQKITKQRKGRRAWFKNMSKGFTLRVDTASLDIFNAQARVQTTEGPKHDRLFKSETPYVMRGVVETSKIDIHTGKKRLTIGPVDRPIPETRVVKSSKPIDGMVEPPPREYVHAARYREFLIEKGDERVRVSEFIVGPIIHEDRGVTTRLYFSGANYMIVKEGKTFRAVSKIYNDRLLALQAWAQDRVIWSTVTELPDTS